MRFLLAVFYEKMINMQKFFQKNNHKLNLWLFYHFHSVINSLGISGLKSKDFS